MRKRQAEHNESVCKFLHQEGKYNDWVLTTAFYSALHYVQHKIFQKPLTKNSKSYNNFESYYADMKNINICKHKATANLVYDEIPIIYAKYNWLKDECNSARYRNYDVSESYARMATEYLEAIKLECM